MDFRYRDYYIVRKNKYTFNDKYIEHIKDFYPVKVKTRYYCFGRGNSSHEQVKDSTDYKENGVYHHLVSIKKEYSKYLKTYMNEAELQYIQVFTEPEEVLLDLETKSVIALRWHNVKQEANISKLYTNFDDYCLDYLNASKTDPSISYMRITKVNISMSIDGSFDFTLCLEGDRKAKVLRHKTDVIKERTDCCNIADNSYFKYLELLHVVGVTRSSHLIGKIVRVNFGKLKYRGSDRVDEYVDIIYNFNKDSKLIIVGDFFKTGEIYKTKQYECESSNSKKGKRFL